MKRFALFATLCSCIGLHAAAKDGYRVQVKFNDAPDSMLYLVHYYAKPFPTVFKSDSLRLDKNGQGVFTGKEKIDGGMYGLMLADRATFVEMVLNNGDDVNLQVGARSEMPKSISFKNSPENEDNQKYSVYMSGIAEAHQKELEELKSAKNKADSTAMREKISATLNKAQTYRTDYIKAHPERLLAKMFRAVDGIKAPEGTHYLQDGKTVDSTYAYRYMKEHYWDNFDLKDGRMVYTPLYEERLSNYLDNWVIPVPDSMIKDVDWLLEAARGSGPLFNYTLSYLSNYSQDSRVMGMDKLYVHLVKNYYMKGDATWMSNDLLEKHIKRMNEIEPNLIGNLAYDIKMKDTSGQKDVSLYGIKAKYKLLVIWEPTCGHCMKEIPMVDSVYRAAQLKKRGVQIVGVCSEVNEKAWKEFIAKHKLDDWTHIYDPEHKSIYKSKYDVYATPTMYLLNERNIIVGKKIDHSNIATLVEMLDKQEAESKKLSNK
jgi:thiol-disulfide isomerase/thioredoxin